MSGWHDDERGLVKSMLLARSTKSRGLHSLVTTPTVIAIICSFVSAAVAGFVGALLGSPEPVSVAIAAGVMLLTSAGLLRYQVAATSEISRVEPRFPSTQNAYPEK
jgi:uncharacterized oligopeptide transporter (OPT) family protein